MASSLGAYELNYELASNIKGISFNCKFCMII